MESMRKAKEAFKTLRKHQPEGDCQIAPPDDINLWTRYEDLDEIFSSLDYDSLKIISTEEFEKMYESGKESDTWYSKDAVDERDRMQSARERFLYG